MPHLDAMLRALADRKAKELHLSEGNRPVFVFGNGERPVSQTVLKRAQIVSLLSELTPNGASAKIAAGEAVKFSYSLPDGTAFRCEVAPSAKGLSVRIRPSEPSAATGEPLAPAASPRPPRFDRSRARPGAPEVEAYLTFAAEAGASDLHLSAEAPPMLRLDGELTGIEGAEPLSPKEAERLLAPLIPERRRKGFETALRTYFAHEIPGVARFRCHVFADRRGPGAAFRVVPTAIPSVRDLGLPEAILDLCSLPKGLVLVTGGAGSGRSTTLACLVDHVNRSRPAHVVTVEDPVEFVHANARGLVNQHEIEPDDETLARALRAALREDPDVVVVGEIRDVETLALALETAETGPLVLGALHSPTAAAAVSRMIDRFPAERQVQVRLALSESLRGVISQTLLRRKGGGRVAALEVLLGVPAVSNLIREGKTFQIPSIMQATREQGMILRNDALLDLVKRGIVEPDEAARRCADRVGFAALLKGAGIPLPPSPGC